MRITPGFTSKVWNLTGGPKGCAHLSGLLMAMASSALQGLWTYRAREPHHDDDISEMANAYLIDSCWVWRRGARWLNACQGVVKFHDINRGQLELKHVRKRDRSR